MLRMLVLSIVVIGASACVSVQKDRYHVAVPLTIDEECPSGCMEIGELKKDSEPHLRASLEEWLPANRPDEAQTMRTWLLAVYEVTDTTDARKPLGEQDEREFELISVAQTARLKEWKALPIESGVHGRTVPTEVFTLVSNRAYVVAPGKDERPLTRDVLRTGIGEVTLGYRLDEEGRPVDVEVLDDYSGEQEMVEYSKRLLDGWRFEHESINDAPLLDKRYSVRFCIHSGHSWARSCRSAPLRPAGHVTEAHPVSLPRPRTVPRGHIP